MQSASHKPIEQTDDIGYLYGHVNLAITPDADLVEGRGLGFTAEQWEAETQPGTGAKHVKVCVRHDETNPVGHVLSTAVKDVDGHKHLMASLWINPNTPSGKAALEERRQGKLQYLSYGFRAQRRVQASKDDGDKGPHPFYRKRLREISLTDNPVFEDARIIVSCSNFDDDDTVNDKATEPQNTAEAQTVTEKATQVAAPTADSSKTKNKDAAAEQQPKSTSVPAPMEGVQHAVTTHTKPETSQHPLQIETVTEQRLQNVVTALEHISSSLSSVMATTATTTPQQTEAAPPVATAAATSLSVPAPADAADEPKLAEAVQKKARELEEMRQELERLRENAAELERIRQHKNEKAEKRRAEEEQKQRERIAALAPKLNKAAGWGEDDAAKEAMFKLGTLEQTAPVVAAMEKMAEKIAHYEELEKRAKAQQEATRKDHQEAWRALSSGGGAAATSSSSSATQTKRKSEVQPPEQKKAQVVAPAAATSKAQTPGDALGAQLQTLFNTNKFQPNLLKEQQQRQPIGAEATKRQAVETADEEADNAAPSAEAATSDPLMDKTPTDYFERAKQEQTYISVKCSKDITPAILNPDPSLWEGGAELPMDQKLFFAASYKDSVIAAPHAQLHPWMYNRNEELRRYGMFQPVSDERAALRRFMMPAWQAAK